MFHIDHNCLSHFNFHIFMFPFLLVDMYGHFIPMIMCNMRTSRCTRSRMLSAHITLFKSDNHKQPNELSTQSYTEWQSKSEWRTFYWIMVKEPDEVTDRSPTVSHREKHASWRHKSFRYEQPCIECQPRQFTLRSQKCKVNLWISGQNAGRSQSRKILHYWGYNPTGTFPIFWKQYLWSVIRATNQNEWLHDLQGSLSIGRWLEVLIISNDVLAIANTLGPFLYFLFSFLHFKEHTIFISKVLVLSFSKLHFCI